MASHIVQQAADILGITYEEAYMSFRELKHIGGSRNVDEIVNYHRKRSAREALQRMAERSGHPRSEEGRFHPPQHVHRRGRRKRREQE
jgi:hypothetical protein